MYLVIAASGGRAPPEENRGGLEDLVGPAQLAVLPLELLHLFSFLGRQAAALTAVDLGLADSLADGLRADAEVFRHLPDGPVALALLGGRLEHEPDRALFQLRWIPPLEWEGGVVWCHDSMILQGMESPPKPVRFSLPPGAQAGRKPRGNPASAVRVMILAAKEQGRYGRSLDVQCRGSSR
jgi:hypothetical protein